MPFLSLRTWKNELCFQILRDKKSKAIFFCTRQSQDSKIPGRIYLWALLRFLDILLTLTHLSIIAFNLFAWIWPKTRRVHLVVAGLTLFSWFIPGIWYGWGYCPITDWQWNIKEKLGETDLPNSFVKYFADDLTGKDLPPSLVDWATLISFLTVISFSVYFNFIYKKEKKIFKK